MGHYGRAGSTVARRKRRISAPTLKKQTNQGPSQEKGETMAYNFRNLVFEGGGVKGIAYVGAMDVLKRKGILDQIQRVGGTSAGAINATLFALGYTNAEQHRILSRLNFKNFLDDSWGVVRDTKRLIKKFGWYKGDFFHDWIAKLVKRKLGDPNATFADLRKAGKCNLYVYGTNLSTRFGEVFSNEHTPRTSIADAVRISMSIPLFFAAHRNQRGDIYVDGGLLNNFPVNLFDREKYIHHARRPKMARETKYYKKENRRFLKKRPASSPYCYNRETLGFRLDTKQQIGVFRHGAEPKHHEVDDFFDYVKALISTIMESQSNSHLHSDDWQRTIYIDTLGVSTTDFGISKAKKKKLRESGRKGTDAYFEWYDDANTTAVNK